MSSTEPPCIYPTFRGQLRVLCLARCDLDPRSSDRDDRESGSIGTQRGLSEVQRVVPESQIPFDSVRSLVSRDLTSIYGRSGQQGRREGGRSGHAHGRLLQAPH